jgi:8-oxo-dGTP pyrophosphatase MutT (NUDIX family)
MKQPLETTWMMLRKDDEVILAFKKIKFGAGKINGIGGKLEPGESPEEAAVRETLEEVGVKATRFERVGRVVFDELDYRGDRRDCIMYCFVATEWEGELIETDEMRPEKFHLDSIPYDQMWEDDQYWLPQVLAGKKIEARFKYDENAKIVDYEVSLQ